jgi:hypothetical protein
MNFKVNWKLFLLVFSFGIFGKLITPVLAQDSIAFKRHSFIQNTLTGHKWGIEIPIHFNFINTSDYDYEDTDAKNPFIFGTSFKLTLKNGWGRGIGIGVGLDYSTNGYLKINIPVDLDFLFAYSIPLSEGELGKKPMQFTISMLSKFVFSKLIANIDGKNIQEYYLRMNLMHFQFNRVAFSTGPTFGLFRNKYSPYFAEKGTWYSIAYIFNK